MRLCGPVANLLLGLLLTTWTGAAWAAGDGDLPPDVRANHWAAPAVQQAIRNGLMTLPDGKAFHGEAKVTRTQAVVLLNRLASALLLERWRTGRSVAVPDRVVATLEQGNWQQKPVSRFTMAVILTRFGNYVANGLVRPPAKSKDLGKSSVLPAKPTITLPSTHPAYSALTALVNGRMIQPGSPLLKPDERPVTGAELSRALAEMAIGLNDHLTELGHDSEGSTPDATFHSKGAPVKPGR